MSRLLAAATGLLALGATGFVLHSLQAKPPIYVYTPSNGQRCLSEG